MKIKLSLLAAAVSVCLSGVSASVIAKECGDSFYCYGDTASSVVATPTRPPPIPPPNTYLRRLQQRNQEHVAMRNHTTIAPVLPRTTATPITHSTPPRATAVIARTMNRAPARADNNDGISVLVIPARPHPAPINRMPPVIPKAVPPVAVCRPAHIAATNRAESLERLGAIAAKREDRTMSVRFFGEARQIRATAPPC